MLRPHIEYFAKLTRDILISGRDYANKTSEQIDKVIVWIVGFAVSGLALIISQSEKLSNYSHDNIICIVTFLTISIVAGVFGRVIYSISSYLGMSVMIRFESKLLAIEFPYKPRILVGNETAETVLEYFKLDFDMDLPIIKNMAQFVEPNLVETYNESVRKYYQDFAKWSDSQLEESKETMDEIMKDTFGFTDKQLKKYAEPSRLKPKLMLWTFWTSAVLYLTSFIAFATAVIVFSNIFISSKV